MEACTTIERDPRPRAADVPRYPGIRFGTDGWRAVMAEDFTFDNLRRVSRATAGFWASSRPEARPGVVVIGGDRRFQSTAFAAAAAEEFAAAGFEVRLADRPIPTPALSLAVRENQAVGGVMITASHNPPEFNGYKLKAAYGGPADDTVTRGIEARLDGVEATVGQGGTGRTTGRIRSVELLAPYLKAVRARIDWDVLRKSGLRIAHDAMHGTGAGVLAAALAGTDCKVTTLRDREDPMFGGVNPEPIPRNYGWTSAWLRRHRQDVCLVTDGDGDRLGLMDGCGRALTTHQAIALVLHHLIRNRGERGRLVTTPNTTGLVLELGAAEGLVVTEVPIGFKHLCREMLRGDVLAGVEESGSIGLARHLPERDGILAGLLLLELIGRERRSVNRLWARLEREFGPHHYGRLDLPAAPGRAAEITEFCRTHPPARLGGSSVCDLRTVDGVKYLNREGAWLMIRASGTEPVIRVYAEAADDRKVATLLGVGRRMLRAAKLV